jgi:serine protease
MYRKQRTSHFTGLYRFCRTHEISCWIGQRFGPAPHGFPVQAWENDMPGRYPYAGSRARRVQLLVETLEERLAPVQYPLWHLQVQPHNYAKDTVLVRTSSKSALTLLADYHKLFSETKRVAADVYELRLQPQTTLADAVRLLRAVPGVMRVEPNYRIQLAAVPNDPMFSSQWALANNQTGANIRALAAWDINTNASNITVAVIDTGIDYKHSDLAANMWRNSREIPNNGLDDDGNGYIDDVFGYDFANNDSDPMDDHGHGTHVAGIIGAVANNGRGIAGVAWNVRLMAVKFLSSNGTGTVADAVRAIDYAVQMGARIINASWGGAGYSSILAQAINRAENAGVLFVTAAGNNGTNNDQTPTYPASFPNTNILAVAASDRNDNLATFSNFGPSTVHLAAPGVGILSTLPNDGYASWSGTSMAAPHVSGAAALLWAMHPDWNFRQVKDRLLKTVDPLPSLQGKLLTGGRLNLERALQESPVRDTLGPRVLRVSWNRTAQALLGAQVTFSETIATFSADSVVVTGPGNQRVRLLSNRRINQNAPGSTFDLTFAPQTQPGTYTLRIGPNVTDLAGNPMDQNADGINGDPVRDIYVAQITLIPTYTYRSGTLNAPIRDYATTTASLIVSQPVKITNVQVQFNVEHSWTGDLLITLTSPSGKTITLVNRRGGSGDNFADTVLTDQADVPIAAGIAPFRGSYRPEQPLGVFRDQDASGTWTLRIQDRAGGDTGRLVNWSLYIEGLPIANSRARSTSARPSGSIRRPLVSNVEKLTGDADTGLSLTRSTPFANVTWSDSLFDNPLAFGNKTYISSVVTLTNADLERYMALQQADQALSAGMQNFAVGGNFWHFSNRDLEFLSRSFAISNDLGGGFFRYSKLRIVQ